MDETKKIKWYNHFRLVSYPVRLHGKEQYIQQHVTRTKCRYTRHYCKPLEMPHSQIFSKCVKHDNRLCHSIGRYKVHRLNNYLLIPALLLAGGISSDTPTYRVQRDATSLKIPYVIYTFAFEISQYHSDHTL